MGKSEDKKSFQLYNDYIDHFSLMSDEEAGKLIKAIFCYVNDLPCEELAGLPLMALCCRLHCKRTAESENTGNNDIICKNITDDTGQAGGGIRADSKAEQCKAAYHR